MASKLKLESENYEEALKNAEKAFSTDRSRENHQLLKDAVSTGTEQRKKIITRYWVSFEVSKAVTADRI